MDTFIYYCERAWRSGLRVLLKCSCYLIEQETLPALLSTDWFQECGFTIELKQI